ncbi:MAG: extensin, partial [Novosphingobium sp.]
MRRSPLRTVIVLLIIASAGLAGREWLQRHPEHDPWAPLALADPPGWATAMKLQTLRGDRAM